MGISDWANPQSQKIIKNLFSIINKINKKNVIYSILYNYYN